MLDLRKYRKHFFAGIIAGISVFAVLLIIADFKEVLKVLSDINLVLLPVILILAPLNYIFRFIKWNYFLRISNLHPDKKINRYIFMSGLSMTITPAKVGELLKCYMLKEHINAPVSRTSPIVMAERLTDGLAMVILAALGFLAYPYGITVLTISSILLILSITIFHMDSIFYFVINKIESMTENRVVNKMLLFIIEFKKNAKNLFSTKSLVYTVSIGVVSWGLEGFVVYFAVMALGGEISILGSIFVVSVSSLLGAISFLPGGLGVAEGSIMAILILTGTDREIAAAATVITRFSTLWLGVFVGIIGLVLSQKEFGRT